MARGSKLRFWQKLSDQDGATYTTVVLEVLNYKLIHECYSVNILKSAPKVCNKSLLRWKKKAPFRVLYNYSHLQRS